MPHLSPMLWVAVVTMFLVILGSLISSFWWVQMSKFSFKSSSLSLKENVWLW